MDLLKKKILASGHSTRSLEKEEEEKLTKNYFVMQDGGMRCYPGGIVMPSNFKKTEHLLYNFEYNPEDVIVAPFPKSGTTWTQEIVWNLIHNPDGDNPEASVSLDAKFPEYDADIFLEASGVEPPDEETDTIQLFRQLYPEEPKKITGLLVKLSRHMPSPRLLKSHLPMSLYPRDILERCKVIYIARDPRDVINSLYHFVKLQKLWKFNGTKEDFIDDFINDRIIYGPYFAHVKAAWDLRHHPNMLFLFFEDLKFNPLKEIEKVNRFLGTKRTHEQIIKVAELCSFDVVKERSKENPPGSNAFQYYDKEEIAKGNTFFRKGLVGDWKNNFSQEQGERLTKWMERNVPVFGPEFKYQNMY